ncbi:MAG: hypothetical protein RL529_1256 [Actinomycetota bacterium]
MWLLGSPTFGRLFERDWDDHVGFPVIRAGVVGSGQNRALHDLAVVGANHPGGWHLHLERAGGDLSVIVLFGNFCERRHQGDRIDWWIRRDPDRLVVLAGDVEWAAQFGPLALFRDDAEGDINTYLEVIPLAGYFENLTIGQISG